MGLTTKILKNESPVRGFWAYLRGRMAGCRVDAPPIFVLGCGHSGTSVLLRLLGAHSRIYGVPYESRVFMHSAFKQWLTGKIWNRDAIGQRKHRWVEKTPAHVRELAAVFKRYPDAKVVFMIRDGRDVAVSLRKRFGDFEKGLKRWLDDNRDGLEWVDGKRVMMLKYEDLVKNYEQVMPEVCRFIGEPFEEGMLAYHEQPAYVFSKNLKDPGAESGKDHKHYRNWQINQKLFDGSGKWKTEMTEAEKVRFKEAAQDLLVQFGYVDSADW